jgi:hypothetical protein
MYLEECPTGHSPLLVVSFNHIQSCYNTDPSVSSCTIQLNILLLGDNQGREKWVVCVIYAACMEEMRNAYKILSG